MKKFILYTIAFPIVLVVFLGPGIMLAGFTVQQLWTWFIVPLGLPAISLWHGLGIDILVTFLTSSGKAFEKTEKEFDKEDAKKWFQLVYLRPIIILALGWLTAYMMGSVL